jgi:hypothetical protein
MKGNCKFFSKDKEEIKPGFFLSGCNLMGNSCVGFNQCEDCEEEE